MPELRDYQQKALTQVFSTLGERGRTLLSAPTGSGKTAVAAEMIRQAVASGQVAVFLVHRDVLITQTRRTLDRWGLSGIALERASERAVQQAEGGVAHFADPATAIILASTATLTTSRGARLRAIIEAAARSGRQVLVIYDEAHHAGAVGVRRYLTPLVHQEIETGRVSGYIGLTATAFRADGSTGKLEAAFGPKDAWVYIHQQGLFRSGHLVPHKETYLGVVTDQELDEITLAAGDYDVTALDEVINTERVNRAIANAVVERRGQAGIVFTVSVVHALAIKGLLDEAGISAAIITGETPAPERDALLDLFQGGEIAVLVNCMVLTEGFDAPRTQYAVIGRPTRSAVLYRQIVGRTKRPFPGKTAAEVVLLTRPRRGKDQDPAEQRSSSAGPYKGMMEEALRRRTVAEAQGRALVRRAARCIEDLQDLCTLLTNLSGGVVPWLPVVIPAPDRSGAITYAGSIVPAAPFLGQQWDYTYHAIFALATPADPENGRHYVHLAEAARREGQRSFSLREPVTIEALPPEEVYPTVATFATQRSQWAETWFQLETSEYRPSHVTLSTYNLPERDSLEAIIDQVERSRRLGGEADQVLTWLRSQHWVPFRTWPAAKLGLITGMHRYLAGFAMAASSAKLYLDNNFSNYVSRGGDDLNDDQEGTGHGR